MNMEVILWEKGAKGIDKLEELRAEQAKIINQMGNETKDKYGAWRK